MQASELRIGNWVYIPGLNRYVKVLAIFKIHFRCEDENGVQYDESIRLNYQPIPLTTEVLLKCGFNSATDDGIKYWFINKNITIDYSIRNNKFTLEGFIIDITSLHQLQNLFFALTGEELNYNPCSPS